MFRKVKWFIQRGLRGYSDADLWDFDSYLAGVIGGGCKQMAEKSMGYPVDFPSFEEWQKTLKEISDGFMAYKENLYEDVSFNPDTAKEFQRALDLFKQHFPSLWD